MLTLTYTYGIVSTPKYAAETKKTNIDWKFHNKKCQLLTEISPVESHGHVVLPHGHRIGGLVEILLFVLVLVVVLAGVGTVKL